MTIDRRGRRRARLFRALMVALLATTAIDCTRRKPPPRPGVLVVSREQQASWVRNFNPLMSSGARWPSLGGVYEPMLIFNTMTGEYVPWLATGYAWEQGNRVLRLTIREGVRFSDGQPFSALDVAYTFGLLREHPALDLGGVWRFLTSLEAPDATTVVATFQRPFVPGLHYLAHQPIVPRHIWSKVDDPVSFANPEPVATGPFTEVRVFQNQVYELGRNPHYWQPGKPAITGLRMPALPGNDQANMALVGGEVDWAGNFIPAVERVFVQRDPEHHAYWFPLVGTTVFLYPNTTRPPFDDVRVRKALSMAIDRELVVKVAMYAYTRPSDATGLSDAHAGWRDADAVAAGTWVGRDIAAANALLDAAGLPRGKDGVRRGPDGKAMSYDILVVSGWSDWVRAAQVIARGLGDVGVEATVRTYDFSAWFDRMQRGDFDLGVAWSNEGPTPYDVYRWLMSAKTVQPVGASSAGNFHRYASAAAAPVLDAFEATADRAEQQRLAAQLQRIFVAEAPAIPLFPNPAWGAFNTTRFSGFPTAADPYASLSPNKEPECLLVLTALRPN